MRVVLDTNVVVSGFLWGGTRQLLQAAREKKLQLYTSTPLLLELTDILGAPSSRVNSQQRNCRSISSLSAMPY